MLALALTAAQPAAASPVETNCENLAATLTAATPGETIVLSGLCSAPNANFVLPETAGLTIEGAPAGVNGFDGTGAGGAALTSPPEGVDGLTVRNLAFENYEGSGGAFIKSTKTATRPFAFLHDTFTHNTSSENGGGLHLNVEEPGTCAFSGSGPPVTLADSTFSENTETFQAGGGAFIDLECHAGSISASVTNNVFMHNRVASNTEPLQGGGLWVGLGHEIVEVVPFALTQQNNLLEGNAVENTSAEGHRVEGGGEFTDGGGVTSLGDRFVDNRIDGAKSSTWDSEGGGFASLDPGACSITPGAVSTATDLVAAGNTIGPPSGTGKAGEGGGVYVGCLPGGHGYHLTLINSTVSGNTAAGSGAAAGLDGETGDTAVLENTIVAGNLAGSDLGGFGASDGEHVSAAFSDLCAIGSTTVAFAGAGNICASPALVDAPGGDAHETAASPTIDAGSNALIGSVATDVFGDARILAGRTGDAPTVDIGAAESPAAPDHPARGAATRDPRRARSRSRERRPVQGLPRRGQGHDRLHRPRRPDVLGRRDAEDRRDLAGQAPPGGGGRRSRASQADGDGRQRELQRAESRQLRHLAPEAERQGTCAAAPLPPAARASRRDPADRHRDRHDRDGAAQDPLTARQAPPLAPRAATPRRRASPGVCAGPVWAAAPRASTARRGTARCGSRARPRPPRGCPPPRPGRPPLPPRAPCR